jgi:hypothetical protein
MTTVALAIDGARTPAAEAIQRLPLPLHGTYYLAMIAPVLVLGSGVVSAGIYGWIVLGVIIVGGSKLILVGDRAGKGKFS